MENKKLILFPSVMSPFAKRFQLGYFGTQLLEIFQQFYPAEVLDRRNVLVNSYHNKIGGLCFVIHAKGRDC